MKYWQFFPSGDGALGCLPVWGFATIVESAVEGLAVGRRAQPGAAAGHTVYVDFPGDADLLRRIHTRFGDHPTFSRSLGGTHWEALGSARYFKDASALPG